MTRTVQVVIKADTRGFAREMKRGQIRLERRWWKRLALRFAVWCIDRDLRRHPRE